jgi:sulfofructose kinase
LFDVSGIGAYCLDYLSVVESYPSEDEKMEVNHIEIQGGGNVATALVAVGRLGGKVCYQGIIGNDENTNSILNGLKRENVDISHIIVEEGKNPFSFIIINTKNNSRTILYTKSEVPLFKEENIDVGVIQDSKVLLLDFYHEEASLAASRVAHGKNIPVVIDAESIKPLSSEIMKNATHIVASKSFALEFTGRSSNSVMEEVLKRLSEKVSCPFVCITLGEQGAIGLESQTGRTYFQEAFPVEVVDTTGAGDVFHGAFSFFLSRDYSMDAILRYASGCAALACREIGGRKGIPTMNELMEFLKDKQPRIV